MLETSAETLVSFITGVAGERQVCLEEGSLAEWVCELLRPHVAGLVVVQPPKRTGHKSDASDAHWLADGLRKGTHERVVFKNVVPSLAGLREAVRTHRAILQDVVRTKNRLRVVFRSRGINVKGSNAPYAPDTRQEWLDQLAHPYRRRAEYLATELDGLEPLRKNAKKWLLEEASKVDAARLVATVPGIGPIRAAQIVAIVMTPTRFRTRSQFWSYAGLGIITRSSSDWTMHGSGGWKRSRTLQTRGLNPVRNGLLKMAFKGAALTVITKLPDHPLHANYKRMLASGVKPPLARLTLARRIAAATLAVWKTKEAYDPEKHVAKKAA